MAEETKDTSAVEEVTEQASTQEQAETTEKTFTQEELDAIVQKEKAKAKRSAEKEYKAKMDEAEKLRKMNAEQKAEYEAQKQADYIAELEAKINRSGLEKEASKMLSDGGIVATDEILGFVVKDGAEATQEAVASFIALVNDLADKKVSGMLKGKTPSRVEQSKTGPMTREEFHLLSYAEQAKVYQDNPDLYAQLNQ